MYHKSFQTNYLNNKQLLKIILGNILTINFTTFICMKWRALKCKDTNDVASINFHIHLLMFKHFFGKKQTNFFVDFVTYIYWFDACLNTQYIVNDKERHSGINNNPILENIQLKHWKIMPSCIKVCDTINALIFFFIHPWNIRTRKLSWFYRRFRVNNDGMAI